MNKKTPLIITLAILSIVFAVDCFILDKSSKDFSKRYLNESIGLAAGTYATSRLINAGVSTLQETIIPISPMGVGMEIAPGQILDPINDATERLSDLCVQSIGLLGVQRIILEVINNFTFIPLYSALVIFLLVTIFTKQRKIAVIILKIVLLFALLRISTPLMCGIGQAADEHYFAPAIENSLENLTGAKAIVTAEFTYEEPEIATDFTTGEDLGAIETVKMFFTEMAVTAKKYYAGVKFRLKKSKEAIFFLKDHSTDIATDLTNLFAAILGKVAVQVFLLPLATLALIRWIFKQVTESSLDDFVGLCRNKLQINKPTETPAVQQMES